MTNLTLAIPEDLHKRMKMHSEIRWSEVIRKTISKKVDDLELMNKLSNENKLTKEDIKIISKKINSNVSRKLGL